MFCVRLGSCTRVQGMKKQKKQFAWYRTALGLSEPFQVVVSESAVASVFGEHGLGAECLERDLVQTCGGPCTLALAGCALAKLQGGRLGGGDPWHAHRFCAAQGRDALPTIMKAKKATARVDCGHAQPLPFAECVADLREQQSGTSWVALVAAQEEARKATQVALSVPVVLLLAEGKFKVCEPTSKARELAVELGVQKVSRYEFVGCDHSTAVPRYRLRLKWLPLLQQGNRLPRRISSAARSERGGRASRGCV
jgi:hypothetical protein